MKCVFGGGGEVVDLRLSWLWRDFLYVARNDWLSVCVCVKGGMSLVVFSLERRSLCSSLRVERFVGVGVSGCVSIGGQSLYSYLSKNKSVFGGRGGGCLLVVLAKMLVCWAGEGGAVGVMY